MKNSKFCHFWPNRQCPPLEKNRFLAPRQIFIERLPNELVCRKTSSGTHFGTPKGPETKKWPKDKVRVKVGVRVKRFLFVSLLFVHKNQS